ncbi:MAG: hypothetical protein M1829_000935 [Trizodia sp. TS-e1964]|nr:MAG: hypothetical protein M1829_000935 [Trizodia sp. TS-e1964]
MTPISLRDLQEDEDEAAIRSILSNEQYENSSLENLITRPLEPGDKADDAVDYEDFEFSDDNASEQGHSLAGSPRLKLPLADDSLFDIDDDIQGQGTDDLFGSDVEDQDDDVEDELEALMQEGKVVEGNGPGIRSLEASRRHAGSLEYLFRGEKDVSIEYGPEAGDIEFEAQRAERHPSFTLEAEPFAQGIRENPLRPIKFREIDFGQKEENIDLTIPPPPEDNDMILEAIWPRFQKDGVPNFLELIPAKRAYYLGKQPAKQPKPLNTSKLGLEFLPDQEKSFRVPGTATWSKRMLLAHAEEQGIIVDHDIEDDSNNSADEVNFEEEDKEDISGIAWTDFELMCANWDDVIDTPSELGDNPYCIDDAELFEGSGEDIADLPSAKRQKLAHSWDSMLLTNYCVPSLDDPELLAAKVAKKVQLDASDTQLLLEIIDDPVAHAAGTKKLSFDGNLKKYNISNDDPYSLQYYYNGVRGTLGNVSVEHSLPALRLQWPYYQTKLGTRAARSFHRPTLMFNPNQWVQFSKPAHVKKKYLKGKNIQSIFNSTKDLSLGDNSHVLLLEYSEEHPTIMSNFGMSSRIINYYRRKNIEDNSRPKLEIGETAVLLPQDQSPFSIFGSIESGTIQPGIHNAMFRAPIFKHQAKATDFLIIRNRTGIEGQYWYIRKIDHLYVAGQEFPSIEVPGPHARKVTTAAKNRLKMIIYRRARKHPYNRINISEITPHFPETTDLQNRQKMKEFMTWSKVHKEWEINSLKDETLKEVPPESILRTLITPEDVCLLEGMQVGQRHLQDAGFTKDLDDIDDDADAGHGIEHQMAPWNTTKNFIHATQGKAMLQLHGEGDPTGRGEAFSFLKTSMKGGFRALGESVEDKIDAKKLKEMGGHAYNVVKQQKAYDEAIKRIWEAQKKSLSSSYEEMDTDSDFPLGIDDIIDNGQAQKPVTSAAIPSRLHEDDSASQVSKGSLFSQHGKALRITRITRTAIGQLETLEELIHDPTVIRQYIKRRKAIDSESKQYVFPISVLLLSDLSPTSDEHQNRLDEKRIKLELERLSRNKDRRLARDKTRVIPSADDRLDSPGSPNSPNVAPRIDTLDTRFSNHVSPKLWQSQRPRWNTLEFWGYYFVFLIVIPSMFKCVYDISKPAAPNYPEYSRLLSPGWIPGRKVDNSDAQYSGFRNNIPYLLTVLIAHPLLRRLFNFSFPIPDILQRDGDKRPPSKNGLLAQARLSQRTSFDLLFALLFLAALRGVSTLKILAILYTNYSLATRLPPRYIPLATWVFNIGIMFANELGHGYPFEHMANLISPSRSPLEPNWGARLDRYGGLLPRWEILFNITVLRLISFNLDYYWSVVGGDSCSLEVSQSTRPVALLGHRANGIKKKQPEPGHLSEKDRIGVSAKVGDFNFKNYLAYALYSPLYLAGPIITFNDYIAQLRHPSPSITRRRTILYGIRFLLALLCMELVLHFIYAVAISKSRPNWSMYSPYQLSMLGYFNLHIIWLKLLLPWRFFRLWALIDGVDAPENMVRCMSDNYSALAFWRGWHRSFNRWTIRYIYVPLGGSGSSGGKFAVPRVVLNYLCVFTFVALWHDINLTLLTWGWLVTLFILPEILAGFLFPRRKWEHRPTAYRVLCGVGAVGNILMMMAANLVGFAIGVEGLRGMVHGIAGSYSGLFFLGAACSALFVGVQVMFEVREQERRDGIRLSLTPMTKLVKSRPSTGMRSGAEDSLQKGYCKRLPSSAMSQTRGTRQARQWGSAEPTTEDEAGRGPFWKEDSASAALFLWLTPPILDAAISKAHGADFKRFAATKGNFCWRIGAAPSAVSRDERNMQNAMAGADPTRRRHAKRCTAVPSTALGLWCTSTLCASGPRDTLIGRIAISRLFPSEHSIRFPHPVPQRRAWPWNIFAPPAVQQFIAASTTVRPRSCASILHTHIYSVAASVAAAMRALAIIAALLAFIAAAFAQSGSTTTTSTSTSTLTRTRTVSSVVATVTMLRASSLLTSTSSAVPSAGTSLAFASANYSTASSTMSSPPQTTSLAPYTFLGAAPTSHRASINVTLVAGFIALLAYLL